MAETVREVRIQGRVQGVHYRAWTQEQATRLGLRGWVRNEPDGSVTALIGGETTAVERMIALCREGPQDARVDLVETREARPPTLRPGFDILR